MLKSGNLTSALNIPPPHIQRTHLIHHPLPLHLALALKHVGDNFDRHVSTIAVDILDHHLLGLDLKRFVIQSLEFGGSIQSSYKSLESTHAT